MLIVDHSDGCDNPAALLCSWTGDEANTPEARAVRGLRFHLLLAARQGFKRDVLALAYDDASFLVSRWAGFLQPGHSTNDLVTRGAIPVATAIFARQLCLYTLPSRPGASTYCLYGHAAALFVTTRLDPVVHACRHVGLLKRSGVVSWATRSAARYRTQPVPEFLYKRMRLELTLALLNFGRDRVLDQATFVGWPVGAAHLVELMGALRHVCTGSGGCTVGAFERTANIRLGLVRHRGNLRARPAGAAWWNEGWLGRLLPWMSPYGVRVRAAERLDSVKLSQCTSCFRVFMLGTHGAVFDEIKHSWRAAMAKVGMGCKNLVFHMLGGQHFYNLNVYLETNRQARHEWVSSTPWDLLMKRLAFYVRRVVDIDPGSVLALVDETRKVVSNGDIGVLVCTIPSIICAGLSALPLPVVHWAFTVPTAQVFHKNNGAWLALFSKMAQDPKNHFLVSSPYTRAQVEYLVGIRLPLIPTLSLYITSNYSGHLSQNILVFDRDPFNMLLRAIYAMTPSNYPFTFVGHTKTDKLFSTFSKYRATVYVPSNFPEQMSFYELYKLEMPLFVPTRPDHYLFPRLDVFHVRQTRCLLSSWLGNHQLEFNISGIRSLVNYSFSCSGRVSVKAGVLGGFMKREDAVVTPLRAMDEFGNTHWLRAVQIGARSNLRSHGDRCARLAYGDRDIRVMLGPALGICHSLDQHDACASGPLPGCRSSNWETSRYVASPPSMSVPEVESIEGFDRHSWGGVLWWLGTTRLPRSSSSTTRKRGSKLLRPFGDREERLCATSPMDLSSHQAFDEHVAVADFFRFPGVGHFASASELMLRLTELETQKVAAKVRAFQSARRETALAAWRLTLTEVSNHPSQQHQSRWFPY